MRASTERRRPKRGHAVDVEAAAAAVGFGLVPDPAELAAENWGEPLLSPPVRGDRLRSGHIHLPSIHIRSADGRSGFDYEEDIYVRGRGSRRAVLREVKLTAIEAGCVCLDRLTADQLSEEDQRELEESLSFLTATDLLTGEMVYPEAAAEMEKRARFEYQRQLRIASGAEQACAACGCSETRACSGGCIWATRALCSRCVR